MKDYRFGLHYPIPSPVPGSKTAAESWLMPDERARLYKGPAIPDHEIPPWNCSECGTELRMSSFNRTHCVICNAALCMDCVCVQDLCEECLEVMCTGHLPAACTGSHVCPSHYIPGKCLCGRDSAEPEGR